MACVRHLQAVHGARRWPSLRIDRPLTQAMGRRRCCASGATGRRSSQRLHTAEPLFAGCTLLSAKGSSARCVKPSVHRRPPWMAEVGPENLAGAIFCWSPTSPRDGLEACHATALRDPEPTTERVRIKTSLDLNEFIKKITRNC